MGVRLYVWLCDLSYKIYAVAHALGLAVLLLLICPAAPEVA